MDKNLVAHKDLRKFVVVFWLRQLIEHRMKARNLKRIEMYKVRINPALDQYQSMPLFQGKIDEGEALLAAVGLPAGIVA